ncbi:MAG: hypothetical protein WC005_11715, partial [Candidatus Nanopelagicales bacterium]
MKPARIRLSGKPSEQLLFLSGPAVYLMIYALAMLRGVRFDYMREGLWQFIPPTELSSAPLSDLWLMHG